MPASASCLAFEVPAVRIIDPPPVFDFRAHFCHSAPMETHAFGFTLRANAPEGQKRFPLSGLTRLAGTAACYKDE
jgi:hypothetical protein